MEAVVVFVLAVASGAAVLGGTGILLMNAWDYFEERKRLCPECQRAKESR